LRAASLDLKWERIGTRCPLMHIIRLLLIGLARQPHEAEVWTRDHPLLPFHLAYFVFQPLITARAEDDNETSLIAGFDSEKIQQV